MSMTPRPGSLLWVSLPGPHLTREDQDYLRRIDPMGVVIFRENILDPRQVMELNEAIRAACPSGRVMIAVDQEGGRVARLREGVPPLGPMRSLAATGEVAKIRTAGRELGKALRTLGFDIDFAPVLDVDSNPKNPIIGDRAFSGDPEKVGPLAMAFAKGLLEEGILPCGKHFPGHGATDLDSHLALPVVEADRETLENRELVPFRAAIAEGIPFMMTAHVVYPAWDDVPATLSRRIVTGLLRERLGFKGLTLTDDLLMEAVAKLGVVNAALLSLEAGCDGLLVLRNTQAALKVFEALSRMADDGNERVCQAAKRVAAWTRPALAWRPD